LLKRGSEVKCVCEMKMRPIEKVRTGNGHYMNWKKRVRSEMCV